MTTIKIGSIQIEDKDENNLFDPKVDVIKNEKGQVLRPESQEVKKLLGEIGIGSLQGPPLSAASRFMTSLAWAQRDAEEGKPYGVAKDLEEIRASAMEMSIEFSEERQEDLIVQAYLMGVESCLRLAKFDSRRGDIEGVKIYLNDARSYSKILAEEHLIISNFDEAEAKKIVDESYHRAVEEGFKNAKKNAEVDELSTLRFSGGHSSYLLGGFFELGRVGLVKAELDRAKKYAGLAGIAFDESRAQKILKSAYPKAAEDCFKKAQQYAEEGYTSRPYMGGMGLGLGFIPMGRSFGLGLSPTSYMGHGLGHLGLPPREEKVDPVGYVKEELDRARGYAAEAGIAFDEVKAEEILRQAYGKGVEILMREMESSVIADHGYLFVKLQQEKLDRILDYAGQGGVSLDTTFPLFQKHLSWTSLEQELEPYIHSAKLWRDSIFFPEVTIQDLDGRRKWFSQGKEAIRSHLCTLIDLRGAVAQGNLEELEGYFKRAGEEAFDLNDRFDIDVGFDPDSWWDLYDQATVNRLEKDFQEAQKKADSGNVEDTLDALYDAYDHSIDYGLDHDDARADAILQKAYEQRLENAYLNAGDASSRGDKKACLEHLKEAEGFSKEMGVPFDKKRAEEIKKLPNPRLHSNFWGTGWRMGGLSLYGYGP